MDLKRLERVSILLRISFEKVSIVLKSGFANLTKSICNIQIHLGDVTNVLPRGANSNGFAVVKLKRKSNNWAHVCFEVVRQESVFLALLSLQKNNA